MSSGMVMIIEDDESLRESVSELLEDAGYTVLCAANGSAALERLRLESEKPDVILLDLMMPVMNGWQFREEQLKDPALCTIPVIVMTATREPRGIQADGLLYKPLKLEKLLDSIRLHSPASAPRRQLGAQAYSGSLGRHLSVASLSAPRAAEQSPSVELLRAYDRPKSSQESLSFVFMQAPVAISVLRGPGLIFEMANELYQKLAGHRDLVGKRLFEARPELRGRGLDELLLRVMRTGEPFVGPEQQVRLDRGKGSEETCWSFIYTPVKGPDGEPWVMELGQDVTQQVEARRLIERSEVKFRSLVDQVGAGIAQVDLDGRFTFANDRYREIVGRTAAELSQRRLQDITHPDDLSSTVEGLEKVIADGSAFLMEKRYLKPDGSIVWVQKSYTRLESGDGRPQGIALVALDITQRKHTEQALKESEERFRNMADNAPVMVWMSEANGECTYLNHSWYALTGQTPQSSLGFGWLSAIHPEEKKRVEEIFVASNARHEGFRMEYRLKDKDGAYRSVVDSAAPRLGPQGEFLGYIGSVIDVTEQVVARERANQLQQATEKLASALTPREVVQIWIDVSEAVVHAAATVVYLIDPSGDLRLEGSSGLSIEGRPELQRLSLDTPLPLSVAIQRRKPVWIETYTELLQEFPNLASSMTPKAKLQAVAAIPLIRGDRVLGGIALSFEEPRHFDEEEQGWLMSLASQCIIATDRVLVYQEEQRARAEAQALAIENEQLLYASRDAEEMQARRASQATFAGDVGAAFTQGGELLPILRRCCELAVRHLDLAFARLWTVNPEGTLLELQASAGLYTHTNGPHSRIPVGEFKIGRIAQHRKPLLTNDLANDPQVNDPDWARREKMISFAGYPLVVEERLIGVFAMFARRPLTQDTFDALAAVARTIAIGIERIRTEEERTHLLKELQQTLEFSETFVGILGHDLRNPLGAITVAADLLLRRESNERISKPIERIRTSAERMGRMIDQMLDFTRARIGGGIPIEPETADLHRLALQIIEELEGTAPQPIQLESSGRTIGQWDSDRLAQVISNLLGNALEHGAPGVPVRLILDGTRSDIVRMSVWNAGVIPEQVLPVLFDPFRRASDKTKKSKGLGLGLYIVQQVVHAHGGSIEARSSGQDGTVFTVSLPRTARRPGRSYRAD